MLRAVVRVEQELSSCRTGPRSATLWGGGGGERERDRRADLTQRRRLNTSLVWPGAPRLGDGKYLSAGFLATTHHSRQSRVADDLDLWWNNAPRKTVKYRSCFNC